MVWLIGIALLLVVWAIVWQRHPKMAFGVLLGLPVAWLASRMIEPYLTGIEHVPLWLPPLPFAIVAVTLFGYGALIWIRAPKSQEHTRISH
jgi:hypothetical protein